MKGIEQLLAVKRQKYIFYGKRAIKIFRLVIGSVVHDA
jgi:hypothetical protein